MRLRILSQLLVPIILSNLSFNLYAIPNHSLCLDKTSVITWSKNTFEYCKHELQNINNNNPSSPDTLTFINNIILYYIYYTNATSNTELKSALTFCELNKNIINYQAINTSDAEKEKNPFLPKTVCNFFMIKLGNSYYSENKFIQAFQWLNQADSTKDNSGLAQFNLGYMFQFGQGTIENQNLALYWYNKASEASPQNNAAVLSNTAIIYMQKQDYPTAFKLYLGAAKLGSTVAQLALAKMYFNGQGTMQDEIEAYSWSSVAVANGFKQEEYTDYKQLQDQARQLRDSLDFRLTLKDKTGVQLAQAKSLAQKYYQLYVLGQSEKELVSKKMVSGGNNNKTTLNEKIKNAWKALTQ